MNKKLYKDKNIETKIKATEKLYLKQALKIAQTECLKSKTRTAYLRIKRVFLSTF